MRLIEADRAKISKLARPFIVKFDSGRVFSSIIHSPVALPLPASNCEVKLLLKRLVLVLSTSAGHLHIRLA